MAVFWSVLLAAIVIGTPESDPRWQRKVSAVAHQLALMAPFVAMGVFLWGWFARTWRLWRSPAGLADVRATPTGWVAAVRNRTGTVAAGVVFTAMVFATAAVPKAMMGKRNPLWVWAVAVPVAAGLAAVAFRRAYYHPRVVIDEAARTVALPTGWRKPPVTVPWDAVAGVDVVVVPGGDGPDEYECVVRVVIDGRPADVPLARSSSKASAERLAAWLRVRIGL